MVLPLSSFADSNLADRLSGRILLQVEDNGEAWYVEPMTKERSFLGRPDDAFRIMRESGLGISEKDFNSFKGKASQRLSGKILLRVEANGEAYYVNPIDLKLHFLGRPTDAFAVMRNLGLGIKNKDLDAIKERSISNSDNLFKNNLSNENNYEVDLFVLYEYKIKLIDKTISALDIYKFIHELNAKEEKDSINFANKITSESGYDTSFGKNIWQLQLNEDLRLIDAYQSSINELKIVQKKLQEKLVAINNGEIVAMTKSEYLLQKSIIDSIVNENTSDIIHKSISGTRFFTPDKRDILNEQIVMAVKKDIKILEQELIFIRTEIAKTPTIVSPPVTRPISLLPQRVNCQTMKTLGGSRTICTEELTMNSYTCDSSKDQYGNRNESCYPSIPNIR